MKTFIFLIQGEVPGKFAMDYGRFGPATMITVAGGTQERALQLLQERLNREVKVLMVTEQKIPELLFDREFVNV
jgi:hypothetical protein